MIALYRPTPAGAALLRSLDLRQMLGEPGFFGSYGFDSWAGVGEARPIGVMHELMHSYWGGFPVMGRPELEWRRDGDAAAPALAAYHRDILAFMAQPPDDYELLRQRLRNLPGVSAANTEPLFHSLEADLPYATGGDLGLVPPILRKYWGLFLATGPFYDWDQAVGWFQSLPAPDRAVAGGYLGFEHLDLRQYGDLPPYAPPGVGLAAAAETLAGEERQRLADFAAQFDLLVGEAQLETDFQFWRRYLRDKVYLFRRHPGHLESLGPGRPRELSGALAFMAGLEGGPAARAAMLTDGIAAQPLLVNFLPAADHLTLLELFAANPELPDAPTLQATASFAQRLQPFAAAVDRVLAAGRESPERGAQALAGFLSDTGLDAEQELRLFFGLFRDADQDAARRITAALDNGTVRALLPSAPVELRTILPPPDLLGKLDITANAADADLQRGPRAAARRAVGQLPHRRAVLGGDVRGNGATGAGITGGGVAGYGGYAVSAGGDDPAAARGGGGGAGQRFGAGGGSGDGGRCGDYAPGADHLPADRGGSGVGGAAGSRVGRPGGKGDSGGVAGLFRL